MKLNSSLMKNRKFSRNYERTVNELLIFVLKKKKNVMLTLSFDIVIKFGMDYLHEIEKFSKLLIKS